MNQAYFEYAVNVIDSLSEGEIYEGMVKAGVDPDSISLRQYPEPAKSSFPFLEPTQAE